MVAQSRCEWLPDAERVTVGKLKKKLTRTRCESVHYRWQLRCSRADYRIGRWVWTSVGLSAGVVLRSIDWALISEAIRSVL